jgi:hypothetical protein
VEKYTQKKHDGGPKFQFGTLKFTNILKARSKNGRSDFPFSGKSGEEGDRITTRNEGRRPDVAATPGRQVTSLLPLMQRLRHLATCHPAAMAEEKN